MSQAKDHNKRLIWALTYANDRQASWEPFSALKMYQSELVTKFSTHIHFDRAETIDGAVAQSKIIKPDIALICPTWRFGCDDIKHLLDALRAAGAIRKIVFIDTCDATSTPFLPLLANVDLYLKPHLFRDTSAYLREYTGGYVFTDYLVHQLGWSIDKWSFGSRAEKEQLGKLRVGWSYGVSSRVRAIASISSLSPLPWALRSTVVNRRFRPVQRNIQEWYEQYRDMASKSVEQLKGRTKISSYERIGYKRYLLELMTSKFALSPFGWGEVCIRDYETVACGALLIKPDMTHVKTAPDIFRKYETYVPIKWDFSDLAQTIDYYVSRPDEAKRIAGNGQRCLLDYFKQKQFLKDFVHHLDG